MATIYSTKETHTRKVVNKTTGRVTAEEVTGPLISDVAKRFPRMARRDRRRMVREMTKLVEKNERKKG